MRQAIILCALLVAVGGCTRTRVITERVPVEVEVIKTVVIPDTSFRKAYASLMEDIFKRRYSVDTLSAGATRSDTLKAISMDLQFARLLDRTLKRFWLQMQ